MSIHSDFIADLLRRLSQDRIDNLLAQADARRILQEVREVSVNFPKFDLALTEKVSHIAYSLLSCACSLIEYEDSEKGEALTILEKAGKALYDAYKYNFDEQITRDYNLLIAGMSLYAAKQYSRAFIILDGIDADNIVGQMVIKFVRKDYEALIQFASNAFFLQTEERLDFLEFDEWVITHEIARCFLVIANYLYTGNQEKFTQINDILTKLLTLARESDLTLYWLIVRLLKIILSTFLDASLWSVLPPLLPVGYMTKKYIRLLSGFKSPVTEMWPSQTASLPLAVGENSGAVINLRTSGGKTRVAEIAILKALSTHTMSKVLYLAPFRSLAFEVEQSLNKIFRPLGITVSQLYGGSTSNVTDYELIGQSQIVIATPEKAKALIRCGSGLEEMVSLIVIDEGHLLGAEERHIKNEVFLAHIKEYASRKHIRMLLLSAVLPNAGDLAKWITGDSNTVAKSEWKPALERLGLLLWDGSRVRLEWKSDGEPFNPNFVQKGPLGFGRRRNPFPNDKKEAISATAVRLAQTGTVMIYSARANSIEGLAESVLLALGEHPQDYPWDHSLWHVFEKICAEELSNNDIILMAARKGIICHNNRLPTNVRIAIERLMRSKPPLVIVASSTLGQGVNVGISTVIISTPYYSDKTISKRDFWNICGRAGRAFCDVEGKILYAIDTTEEKWKVQKNQGLAQSYFDKSRMEIVQSGLLAALNAIFVSAQNTNTDFALLIEAVANDFAETNFREDYEKWINRVFDLFDDELIAMHNDFGGEGDNVDWVDDVFRKSLALIQADTERKDHYIAILRARTNALLRRLPIKSDRGKIIASGIPFSVSKAIFDSVEYFRNLALIIKQSSTKERQNEIIANVIREIEIWSNENAKNIMDFTPEQVALDRMRCQWIDGVPLATLVEIEQDADKIAKEYYGFTLPWIIHAISQMFDRENEENIVRTYASLSMFVELGLPNLVATNIYLAGVRSRSVALELSHFDIFQDKNISEIKQAIFDFNMHEVKLSDSTRSWLVMLSETAKEQAPRKISFPVFTRKKADLPSKMYVRKTNTDCFMVSDDCYFYERVESTDELPYSRIANIPGLYFQCRNDEWHLRSYNPLIVVE